MKNKITTNLLKYLIGMMLFIAPFKTIAQEAIQQQDTSITYIKMWVDGVACPFCAYGIEKKIKKLDGIKDMFIEINEGYITFSVPEAKKPTREMLIKLVNEAGFFARDITYAKTPFAYDDTN